MTEPEDLRSLEQALADIVEKYNELPADSPERAELERMGWVVKLVAGQDHQLGFRPELVIPLVREFLDGLLLR